MSLERLNSDEVQLISKSTQKYQGTSELAGVKNDFPWT